MPGLYGEVFYELLKFLIVVFKYEKAAVTINQLNTILLEGYTWLAKNGK
jgi:hypothetical protein